MKKLITSGIISLAMASALMAAEGDIVFVIDESGSMGPKIQTVIDNVGTMVNALETADVDYQLGLVGFGVNFELTIVDGNFIYKKNPRVLTKLTNDETVFSAGLQELYPTTGAEENGFSAVKLGLSADDMEGLPFRPDAGTCVILISDEEADDPTIKSAALTALSDRDAIFYGIVNLSGRTGLDPLDTADHYGPNPGSLSAETGGSVWDIAEMRTEMFQEMINKCISEAILPEVNFDVHPQSCPNPINTKAKGLTPMAILGTSYFDVNNIDTSSLRVNGLPVTKLAYEDVAEPYTSEEPNGNGCWEYEAIIGEDGEEIPYAGDDFMDLTFKVDTTGLADILSEGVQELSITGLTNDGKPINGTDVVLVK